MTPTVHTFIDGYGNERKVGVREVGGKFYATLDPDGCPMSVLIGWPSEDAAFEGARCMAANGTTLCKPSDIPKVRRELRLSPVSRRAVEARGE